MLKSATGLSTRLRRSVRRPVAGFSLLELLVVIVILGIFVGATVLSLASLRAGPPAETEAQRLNALLDLVAEEALIQGRDFGLEFFEDGYRFLSWDPDSGLWSVIEDEAALRRRTLPDGLRLALAVEGREVVIGTAEERRGQAQDELLPHVGVFSSGEFTPFELFLVTDFIANAWLLRTRVHGEVEVVAPEDAK